MASSYFKTAFEGGFAESQSQELHLHDDDEEAVMGMLRYIYGLNPHIPACDPLSLNLKLFVIAGKYDVVDLLNNTICNVKDELSAEWDSDCFLQVVQNVYNHIPAHKGEMQEVVKSICTKHILELMAKKEFKEVILGMPGLALELLGSTACELKESRATCNRNYGRQNIQFAGPAPYPSYNHNQFHIGL